MASHTYLAYYRSHYRSNGTSSVLLGTCFATAGFVIGLGFFTLVPYEFVRRMVASGAVALDALTMDALVELVLEIGKSVVVSDAIDHLKDLL